MPYFIDELSVSDINLGERFPLVQRISTPYVDERGFWLDFDAAYSGGFRMTIETKVNLMKLRKEQEEPMTVTASSHHIAKSASFVHLSLFSDARSFLYPVLISFEQSASAHEQRRGGQHGVVERRTNTTGRHGRDESRS